MISVSCGSCISSQTGAIDDVHKAVSKESDPEKAEEGKKITQGLAALKYELQHDRQLTYSISLPHHLGDADVRPRPLIDDGGPDIRGYNDELAKRGNPTWFNVSWLFSECYLYR